MGVNKGKTKELTVKELRFIECYMPHRNGARAAREANLSQKNPDVVAYQMLSKPSVKSEVSRRAAIMSREADFTAKEAIDKLAAIARGNLKNFVGERTGFMTLQEFKSLPDEVAYAIESIKITDNQYGTTVQFKLCNKTEAIQTLIELLGFNKATGEGEAMAQLAAALKELHKK